VTLATIPAWRVLVFAFLLIALGRFATAAPPAVTVSGTSLHIEGVTPGGSVVVLGVAREAGYYMARVVPRREILDDEDRDGKIDYAPKRGVAFASIWLVTDSKTGETAVAAPSGYRPLEFHQRGAGRGNVLNVVGNNVLDIGRQNVEIVVIRPGKGAWTTRVRNGIAGPGATPGRSHVNTSSLYPMRADFKDAPPVLIPGDVVLMIDPEQMEYSLTTITPGGH
jgi:hypothetical protein